MGAVRRYRGPDCLGLMHRITNAGSEAINSVVQMRKKRAFGYRNFENFRTVVLFRCGGLDLYPTSHLKAG